MRLTDRLKEYLSENPGQTRKQIVSALQSEGYISTSIYRQLSKLLERGAIYKRKNLFYTYKGTREEVYQIVNQSSIALTAEEIGDTCQMSYPNIARHLLLLTQSNQIQVRRTSPYLYYTHRKQLVERSKVAKTANFTEQLLSFLKQRKKPVGTEKLFEHFSHIPRGTIRGTLGRLIDKQVVKSTPAPGASGHEKVYSLID